MHFTSVFYFPFFGGSELECESQTTFAFAGWNFTSWHLIYLSYHSLTLLGNALFFYGFMGFFLGFYQFCFVSRTRGGVSFGFQLSWLYGSSLSYWVGHPEVLKLIQMTRLLWWLFHLTLSMCRKTMSDFSLLVNVKNEKWQITGERLEEL